MTEQSQPEQIEQESTPILAPNQEPESSNLVGEAKHRKKSIIEKLQDFAKLVESLEEPDQDEIDAMLKDIAQHGQHVFDWINLLEKNAAELKEKGKRLSDAGRVQENRAKQYKDYLKTALKSSGFEKFPMGDITLNLVKQLDYQPKSAAQEKDFLTSPEYVETVFEWKAKPSVMDWVDHKDKVDRAFTWNMDKIKAEIKHQQKILDLKKTTDEQKNAAKIELEKLLELVRIEEKYQLKSIVTKLEKE